MSNLRLVLRFNHEDNREPASRGCGRRDPDRCYACVQQRRHVQQCVTAYIQLGEVLELPWDVSETLVRC